ncbi:MULTISPECIES: hypothetical protein [Dysgonomonas]|nr:hypothetical protein [Dysgonomonas mossii]
MIASNATAQVTIGSNVSPEGGSVLDIKEFTPKSENQTSDKGVVLPRVLLTNKNELYPMYWNTSTNSEVAEYTSNKADLKRTHVGMTVFNVTNTGDFVSGVHTWTGTEWRKIDDSPVIQPQITSLICSGSQMTPNTYTANVPFEGILKVPYLGGNGGSYSGTVAASIGNGLSMERIGGKLAYGGGEVMYRIFGTPTVSSPTATIIPSIDFLGQSCSSIKIGDGMIGINLKNLTSDITISTTYNSVSGDHSQANQLPFGDITITESGSYAFSLRLYGRIGTTSQNRLPFYIYLQKNDKSTLMDAAEIDVVVLGLPTNQQDYSYSVTLGGTFNAGDKVIISMLRPDLSNWTLRQGLSSNSAIRTSLIYWKL